MTKCKHLIRLRGKYGKTLCRVYHKRLWKLSQGENLVIDLIDTGTGKRPVICTERIMSTYNYVGCPYNVLNECRGKKFAPWEEQ